MHKSILIIDDDLSVTRSLGRLLSKQQYYAAVSQNGHEALDDIIKNRHFDLIICDLRLPDIDGVQTMQRIKAHLKEKNRPDIPVLFITGYADSELYQKAKGIGKVLVKPFNNEELLENINQHTGCSVITPLPQNIRELRPTALSVDITNKCNLRCKHCFWYIQKSSWGASTNPDILNLVKTALKKYPTITNVTWYGGEPLIDDETKKLVGEGLHLKKNNLVITNGYYPIPDWHENVHFAASIDGTEKIHDGLRGLPGLYQKTKENISDAVSRNIPIALIYCINAMNIDCIPAFMEEWTKMGLIGMVFTTYVPLRGKDPELTLTDEQRDKIVALLLEMKKKYTTFIGNTELMIELIRGKYSEELAKNCPMNILNKNVKPFSLHMCNDGSIRVPCAFGMGAEHLHCRSITKVALYAGKVLRDRKSFLALFRMYHSKPYSKNKQLSISLVK